jgi:hypothetical protein
MTASQRRTIGAILIWLDVLAWAPYLYLDKLASVEIGIDPFLAVHLTGVLSGVALRLRVEWARIARRG